MNSDEEVGEQDVGDDEVGEQVVGDGKVVDVLPREHAGTARAADRVDHECIGERHAFICQQCFCLVQCLTDGGGKR